jgi:hypothetical protein
MILIATTLLASVTRTGIDEMHLNFAIVGLAQREKNANSSWHYARATPKSQWCMHDYMHPVVAWFTGSK